MQNNTLLFSVIQNALGQCIDPIDQALISREANYEFFCLATPTDLNVLRDIDFFRNHQNEYHFVQLGEYLSFKNLVLDKPFVAYTKRSLGKCKMSGLSIREIVAYKPEWFSKVIQTSKNRILKRMRFSHFILLISILSCCSFSIFIV